MKETLDHFTYYAKLERLIAAILTMTPIILFLVDDNYSQGFRPSISNYVYMQNSYWFGSLLTMAALLFMFNGVQHIQSQQHKALRNVERRFGKEYNIIFGLALFGVLFFDHERYTVIHYIFAIIFFVGCAISMLLTRETPLNMTGNVLGTATLLALGLYFLAEHIIWKNHNPYTLLWAEWLGLFFIAVYFILESIQRDEREKRFKTN